MEIALNRLQGVYIKEEINIFSNKKKLKKTNQTSVLGHEACVEVVEHKRNDCDLNIGDRITFSIADSCGNCDFCLNGLSQKCKLLFKVSL